MIRQSQAQIGKNGLTKNFIESLKSSFKNHTVIRISVLKSAGHEKDKVRNMAEEILSELGNNYNARIIGFTIIVRKWRKPVR
ncbi:MAG TPA: YhbY family RNA-binding protein [Candidatus Omnitrophota bacterium]|nr:YhbY family RNA-binding protein [Candidatus Omnitrophota bacterium]